MGLFRVFIRLFVGFLALLFLRALLFSRGGRPAKEPRMRKGSAPPEKLVRCEACGTALPESRSRLLPDGSGRRACSEECMKRLPVVRASA
jgi:hypothetical protein